MLNKILNICLFRKVLLVEGRRQLTIIEMSILNYMTTRQNYLPLFVLPKNYPRTPCSVDCYHGNHFHYLLNGRFSSPYMNRTVTHEMCVGSQTSWNFLFTSQTSNKFYRTKQTMYCHLLSDQATFYPTNPTVFKNSGWWKKVVSVNCIK